MKRIIYSIISATLLSLTACNSDELNEVIWQNDPNNAGLPLYSEWGYNTFGAYINDEVFASAYSKHWRITKSIGLESKDDKLTLTLYSDSRYMIDEYDTHIYDDIEEDEMELYHIRFTFPHKNIKNSTELADLNGITIDLADEESQVELLFGNETYHKAAVLNVSKGSLQIKRVQLLNIDGQWRETIMSGTFECESTTEAPQGGLKHISIEKGRFDIGIKSYDIITEP